MKISIPQLTGALFVLIASCAAFAAEERISSQPVETAALADPVSGALTPVGGAITEPFDWPPKRPLVMRAAPFDVYRLACETTENPDIDIALWDGPTTDWLFRPYVKMEGGEVVFSTPLGFSRVALKHSSSDLSACRISRLVRDETPRSWQVTYDLARTSRRGFEALALDAGYEVFSLRPDSQGTLSPAEIERDQRAAAAFLVSDLGAAPTRFSVLEGDDPLPFSDKLTASFKQTGDLKVTAPAGIVSMTFWPVMETSRRDQPVCFRLTVNDDELRRLCLPTDPLHGEPADPSQPLPELQYEGGLVGKPLHVRLLVSDKSRLSGAFDHPGWLRAVHLTVLPGWDRVPRVRGETLIALPSRPDVEEPPGPDMRRSASLAELASMPDRFRMPVGTRRQLLRTYAARTRTLLLAPSTPPPPGGRQRLRMLLPAFERTGEEQEATTRKDTVWLPLGGKEAIVRPEPETGGSAELSLVLERKAPLGSVCLLEVADKLFAIAPIERVKKVRFALSSPAPVSAASVDSRCELYTPALAFDVPAGSMEAAAKLRTFFALDGREPLLFELPGPDIPAYVELRVLDARPKSAPAATVVLQNEDGRTVFELAPMHRTKRPLVARHVLPISAASRKVQVSTEVPRGLWIALALRAPAMTEAPAAVGAEPASLAPNPKPPPKTAPALDDLERIDRLTTRLRRLPTPLDGESRARACDILLERAGLYLNLGQSWRAKDDLIMAYQNTEDPAQKERVWSLLERYRDDIGVVAGLLRREPVAASSPELVPLPPGARIEDAARVELSGDDRNLVRIPYDIIWSALPALDDDPDSLGTAELLFLNSVAALHTDWIASAQVLSRLRERFVYRPTDVAWLRTLIRASVFGQTVPKKLRLPALSSALEIERTYGLDRPVLSAPIGAMSRWELTEGFTGITRTLPPPEVDAEAAWNSLSDDIIEQVAWEDPWSEGGHVSLVPGDTKLVELAGHPPMQAVVEARFLMRPLSDGRAPRCHLRIRSSADLDTRLTGPSLAFEAARRVSSPFELPAGEAVLSLAFECADPQARGRVRARLWLDRPISQSHAKAPAKKGFGHLLMLSTAARWKALDKGATAKLQIKGPTVLRLRYRGSSSGPETVGTLRVTAPDGSAQQQTLFGREGKIFEVVTNLPASGVYAVRLEALDHLKLTAHHRVPTERHSLIGTDIERPIPKPSFVAQQSPRIEHAPEHRVVGRLRESGPPGTLWLGIRAETDAVAKERLDTRSTPWVAGPEAAFLSRLEPHRLWLYGRSGTRLRLRGLPTNTAAIGAELDLPAGTSFRADLSGAWQPVGPRIESAYRARIGAEHDFPLTGTLDLTPRASIRAAHLSMQRLGSAAAEEVDSTIFNRYLRDHDLGLDLSLRLKWRPLWPLLIELTLEERSNRDFNPIAPDRVEAELDVFAAYEGFVGHLETSLGRRFADADRGAGSTLSTLGAWLTYNYWLSSEVSILTTAGGRYLFDLGRYDASAYVFAVFSFGRSLSDEPPSRRPLRGALERDRPVDVRLETSKGAEP